MFFKKRLWLNLADNCDKFNSDQTFTGI